MPLTFAKKAALATLSAGLLFTFSSDSHAETTDAGNNPAVLYISSPAPGTHYPDAPALVDLDIIVGQGDFETISEVDIYVDGVLVVDNVSCWDGCLVQDLELTEGEHLIEAVAPADDDFVTVTVGDVPGGDTGGTTGGEGGGEEGGDTGGTTGGEEGGSEGGGDEAADEGGDDGYEADLGDRGCNLGGSPASPLGLLAIPALLLLGLRRREG